MVSAGKQRPKNLASDFTKKPVVIRTKARFFSRLFASQKWLLRMTDGVTVNSYHNTIVKELSAGRLCYFDIDRQICFNEPSFSVQV
jgi:hypothetical protein